MSSKPDYSRVSAEHGEIDTRLREWSRWVAVGPERGQTMPMFAQYQSKSRQWEQDPHIPVAVDTLQCVETEKVVSTLPESHRTAIRWAYVWPWLPVHVIQKHLGVTPAALMKLISDGRTLVENVLKRKSSFK
jgi:hypothetical protein